MNTQFRIVVMAFSVQMIFFPTARAAENMKLPYAAGERFVVSTGYDSPPTHIKKDSYAIDFTQNGCDAYGKPAVAAFSGTAWIVDEDGYNGGYGTQLLVLSEGNIVTRYAHMVPGSIPLRDGDEVPQGTVVGEIGDTGLVAGNACGDHPGTHIHFAVYTENADGSFSAKDPEPISGYSDITEEQWYVSDNALAATKENLATLIEILESLLGGQTSQINNESQKTDTSFAVSSSSAVASERSSTVSSSSPRGSSAVPEVSFSASSIDSSSVKLPLLATGNPATNSASSEVSVAPILFSGGGGNGPTIFPILGETSSGVAASLASIAAATSSVLDDPTDDVVAACQQ